MNEWWNYDKKKTRTVSSAEEEIMIRADEIVISKKN